MSTWTKIAAEQKQRKPTKADENLKIANEWNDNEMTQGRRQLDRPYAHLTVLLAPGSNDPRYGDFVCEIHNSYSIRAELKQAGYRYSQTDRCWYRVCKTFTQVEWLIAILRNDNLIQ